MTLVLYKYLNCAVHKANKTGHATNINYTLIPSMMMVFIISSWSKPRAMLLNLACFAEWTS